MKPPTDPSGDAETGAIPKISDEGGETSLLRTVGRYHLLEELGRGAMGIVYKGFDPVIGRTVALKTITFGETDAESRDRRARLYREAGAAGTLSHPNIVTIYDVIEEGGTTAVAMEFIEGRTLSDIIEERAPMAMETALDIFEQLCAGIDYAGARGIIHRDIKPANILVTQNGRIKVADFGVAKLAVSHMTQTGMVMGSPAYMSPEQIRGQPLDSRSDLFSACIVFYELLTGQRPFSSDDLATTMFRIVHEPPKPVSDFNQAIPSPINAIFERALAKDREDRYATGADLCAEFRQALRQALPAAAPTVAEAAPKRRMSVVLGVAAIAIAVLAGIAVMSGAFSRSAPAEQPTPTTVSRAPTPPATVPRTTPAAGTPATPGGSTTPTVPGSPAGAMTTTAPVPVAPAVPMASVSLKFDGASFPVTIMANGKSAGRVSDSGGRVKVPVGEVRLRAVSPQVFLDRDFGTTKLDADERHTLTLPATASAFIGVKGEAYEGLQILIDGRPVPGSYPAQVPQITAAPHRIVFRWKGGSLDGTQINKSIDLTGGKHFLVRAAPEDEQVVVQKVR